MIILCPRLGGWILEAASEAEINLKSYGLPEDEYMLHKVINLRLDRFAQLVLSLKARSEMVKLLAAALRDPG